MTKQKPIWTCTDKIPPNWYGDDGDWVLVDSRYTYTKAEGSWERKSDLSDLELKYFTPEINHKMSNPELNQTTPSKFDFPSFMIGVIAGIMMFMYVAWEKLVG